MSYEEAAGNLPWTEDGYILLTRIYETIQKHREATSKPRFHGDKVNVISEDSNTYTLKAINK